MSGAVAEAMAPDVDFHPSRRVADVKDVEAEKRLIGRALYSADMRALDDLLSMVHPADFYTPEYGQLWAIVTRRRRAGQAIDLLSIKALLEGECPRLLEGIGGPVGLVRMVDEAMPGMRWFDYARRITDLARRRRLIDAGEKIVELGQTDAPLSELAASAATALHEADVVPPSDGIGLADALVNRFVAGTAPKRWATGIDGLDRAFMGGVPAGYHIVAARTSSGKSALMVSMLHRMAIVDGARAIVASVEMDAATVALRLVAHRHRVNGYRLMALHEGNMADRDVEVISETSEILRGARIAIETRRLRIDDIRWRAHHARREWGGVDVVFIDYIQRMTPPDRRAPRYQQIADMSAACKRLSEELDVPVIVMAQLGRDAASEDRPKLHHLRESGDLEQDADSVWLLWRDGTNAAVEIAKHRNGPLADVPLVFHPASMTFEDQPEDAR